MGLVAIFLPFGLYFVFIAQLFYLNPNDTGNMKVTMIAQTK